MNVRLVRCVDGKMLAEEFDAGIDTIATMEARGFVYAGKFILSGCRPELQGAPKFMGLCGPMWDGDAIRYEDAEAYARLSS